MSAPLFIGDEVTAAGFHLAGVRTRTPSFDDLGKVLEWAQDNASLILLTAEYANRLSPEDRNRLLTQTVPPLVVIPDVRAGIAVDDLATELRQQLGVME
ncbi:MAG: V-type ATP synthase subunit F [Gammaproteobacteria bacterium]|jgi:vacuolar-type H+-ATPase subunit F/Vma7